MAANEEAAAKESAKAKEPTKAPAKPGGDARPAPVTEHKHGGLGEFASTAICGNDITSSCLYVSALVTLQAGRLAPFALLLVAGLLFLFRKIYAEVVGALPLNGGAYNALLNTTSKQWASLAACLTLLSYMATAVISGLEAMHYVHHLWHSFPWFYATIGVLAFFMVLTIIGIGESAAVAIGIFVLHLSSLTLLLIVGGAYLLFSDSGGTAQFWANWDLELPHGYTFYAALFFGFSTSMLGISGFESSSNFVEEQEEGVFPKTLRNMWMAVSFFNPAMAFLVLALIPIGDVGEHQNALLSHLGEVAGGKWLATLISIDAVLVLSGAVLTSFVGVTGLAHRMTLDRCLPQYLLKQNSRGTYHRIVIVFFALCVSVLFICEAQANKESEVVAEALAAVTTKEGETVAAALVGMTTKEGEEAVDVLARVITTEGETAADVLTRVYIEDGKTAAAALVGVITKEGETAADMLARVYNKSAVDVLAGVYTISFLSVMALFGIGNVLLKIRRARLPRPVKAKWAAVLVAIGAVIAGLAGNISMNPDYFKIFLWYFIPAMAFIFIMLNRVALLKGGLFFTRNVAEVIGGFMANITGGFEQKIEEINAAQFVFFTRGDNISNLNDAMLYVRNNEHTKRIKVVTVVRNDNEVPPNLKTDLEFLDKAYPDIDIEFVVVKGKFGPKLIDELSEKWNIPANFMFIGSPGDHFLYGLAELRGVRLII